MQKKKDNIMRHDTSRPNRIGLNISPWVIIGSVGILLVVAVVLAYQNYSREKKYMSQILSEKGAAVIQAVEAGARTGMMGMMWGARQIQTLIDETAQLSDILYITVVDKEGFILASSHHDLIGTRMDPGLPQIHPDSSETVNWRMKSIDSRQEVFEVYRYFRPITDQANWMSRRMGRMMPGHGMGMDNDWCFLGTSAGKDTIMMVGLDPRPFVDARQEDVRNTVIISGVLVILGMAGFISLFWLQNYRSARRSLQDTSAVADQVVASLPVGLIAMDKNGNIAFFNTAAECITGLDLSRARGEAPDAVLPYDFRAVKASLDRGETIVEKEMACEFVEGTVVPVSVSASEIINEEGHFVGQLLIIRDLGEVRRLQDEIRRKEKLAAIGGLAAGVAHEIRNPLSSIKGIASYYRDKFEDGSEDKQMAGIMIEEVDRLNRVISELLEFTRPAQLKPKPVDINQLVEHSTRLIQQEAAAKNIQVELHPGSGTAEASVDPDRLTQCFLNVYLNALQAMENSGKLTITTAIRNKTHVIIDIKDTGPGISADDVDKIFDPYFTTKPKGTGLGLAIVHKIIDAHQGQIKVRSTPGRGTVFSIVLPVTADQRGDG
jgi:two-component system sensor histidine kinase HydH